MPPYLIEWREQIRTSVGNGAQARRTREDAAATADPLLRKRLIEIAREFDELASEVERLATSEGPGQPDSVDRQDRDSRHSQSTGKGCVLYPLKHICSRQGSAQHQRFELKMA